MATRVCKSFGVPLEQENRSFIEIQAEDGEEIARDKAQKAFDVLKKPVVVSDDSWLIPGLNNFPGPYMSFVNKCFTPTDWLRLTRELEDRRIILRQIVVYQGAREQKVFCTDVTGELLSEIRGGQKDFPHTAIITFDNGKTSAAQAINKYNSPIIENNYRTSWHDLCEWLTNETRNAQKAAAYAPPHPKPAPQQRHF